MLGPRGDSNYDVDEPHADDEHEVGEYENPETND